MDSAASFGLWLRRRRMALGLTHAALAECAHCSVSALRKIEGDERRPSHRLAERLAACLQVPAAERPSLVKIARGERRIDGLEELSAVALPAPVGLAPFDGTTPSIAVLPFVNLSDDATNEHFADGLAEELLNVLAKIPGLRVASRTSAFSFKGNKEIDIPTVARKLNVATVLEGSVRQGGPARSHHGPARAGGERFTLVVAVLRPGARRYLRSAGRHRAARSCRSCDPRCSASRRTRRRARACGNRCARRPAGAP